MGMLLMSDEPLHAMTYELLNAGIVGSSRSGKATAIDCTLIETTRRNNQEPQVLLWPASRLYEAGSTDGLRSVS